MGRKSRRTHGDGDSRYRDRSSSRNRHESRHGGHDRHGGYENQHSGEQNDHEPKDRKDSNNEKLRVVLRVRPLKNEEMSKGYTVVAEKVDDKMILLRDLPPNKKHQQRKMRNSDRQYVFDKAFGFDSTQEEVYRETTAHLVKNVLEGYNATVFAYGATGGGKTYTMVGAPDNPGIMVRALNELFQAMEKTEDTIYKVTMSYLEIYNENIRDLLNPSSGHLDLRDDSKGRNIQVAGLSEVTTKSTDEVMRLLTKGNRERTQEPTAANKTSSRSHALLMVNVRQTARLRTNTKQAVQNGRLYMIDLAGSERAANTQNRGLRLKEGAHINRSLLALGNCINALAENKTKYVNYRDSKLTRLLKDALSGNCHTVMIAHISPADRHRDESRNTLVYADRAKNISNKIRKNVLDVSYHVSQYQGIIKELKGEIGRLKGKIDSGQVDPSGPSSARRREADELKSLRDALVANFREQMKLRHRLMEIDNHLLSLSMEFEKQNIIVTEWETEKAKTKSDKLYEKKRKKKMKKETPKIYLEPDTDMSTVETSDHDDPESGFEEENNENDWSPKDEEKDNEDQNSDKEDQDKVEEEEHEEEKYVDSVEGAEGFDEKDLDVEDLPERPATMLYNNSDSEQDDDDRIAEPEEPDEVKNAWEELMLIQREQQRYTDIKQDIIEDLDEEKKVGARLENELPKRISTQEEKDMLTLLCKVHELEIDKVTMQSEGLLKEHEVRRRDLMILKYDKQRSLCDEIIQRQQKLIEAMESNKNDGSNNEGACQPMPPELMELYNLYQQELQSRPEKESNFLSELNTMLRSPSMLSLRGPEFEDKTDDRLPPIGQEHEDKLFESSSDLREDNGQDRSDSRLSLQSPIESPTAMHRHGSLPPIDSDREDNPSSPPTSADSTIPSLPPINEHKRRLRRQQSVDGIDTIKSRSRIPLRRRRSSLSHIDSGPIQKLKDAEPPRHDSAPEKGSRIVKKSSLKTRRRKPSEKNIDPFQNVGMSIQRI